MLRVKEPIAPLPRAFYRREELDRLFLRAVCSLRSWGSIAQSHRLLDLGPLASIRTLKEGVWRAGSLLSIPRPHFRPPTCAANPTSRETHNHGGLSVDRLDRGHVGQVNLREAFDFRRRSDRERNLLVRSQASQITGGGGGCACRGRGAQGRAGDHSQTAEDHLGEIGGNE